MIRAKRGPNPPDIATIPKQIGELLDESITGMQVREGGPPAIDLSKIDIDAPAQRFKKSKHKNTDLEALKAAIAAKLERLLRLDRTRAGPSSRASSKGRCRRAWGAAGAAVGAPKAWRPIQSPRAASWAATGRAGW